MVAGENIPGFDRATMEGYAVRAIDTFGARESAPVLLRLAGEVPMGQRAGVRVNPGEAVAVATAVCYPPGRTRWL